MSSRVNIDLLTRVEGHGSVELIRAGGRVVDARLKIHESPRLFEALLVGRRFDEIADIACRICSICSTVHKVAALQAVERALGISVSTQTGLLRQLAVQGGQIESHALHIFCLALPDYLGVCGIQELASREPQLLKTGLRIKKAGNLIQEIVGGRAIHPFNLLPGGMGRVPAAEQLQALAEQLAGLHADVTAGSATVFDLKEILPPMSRPALCAVSGGPPLFGDHLMTSTGETIPAASAAVWLSEAVAEYTHAKVSHFNGSKPFVVGPLARIMLSLPAEYAAGFADASILFSLKARAVELRQALERALVLIDLLLAAGLRKEPPSQAVPSRGEGTALIEAPRGVLLHSYAFDARGVCTAADIITPTAINQGAIAASLKELISAMDGAEYAQIKAAAEILIRCYDPCLSCSVH